MKNPRKSLAVICVLAIVISASMADAKKLLQGIALEWRPTSPLTSRAAEPTIWSAHKIQITGFDDARDNKNLIGENHEDESEGTVLPVSTTSDVPVWVADRFKYLLKQNGLNMVESGGDFLVDGELQHFFVVEGEDYKANIRLHVRLRDAAGSILWESDLNANETRFGRSYKKDNYCETLSDTLINLTQLLLDNSQFRDAVINSR